MAADPTDQPGRLPPFPPAHCLPERPKSSSWRGSQATAHSPHAPKTRALPRRQHETVILARQTDAAWPRPPRATIDVLVLQPYTFHLPPGIDARLHQTDRFDEESEQVVIDGLNCTSLARTLCDLGAVCPERDVWKALISARRDHDLSPHWLAKTARLLERPGPTGSATIRRLLVRWGTEGALPESWLEELMARLLDDPQIPGVVRQHTVLDASGAFVARVDAAAPAARLALEGHSRAFHFGPVREAADEDRDLRLTAAGFETIYLGWYATKTPTAVAATIRQIVADRLQLFATSA